MGPTATLIQHETIFDALVHELATIGKTIEDEDLIVIYAGSLPNEHFGTWIQSQMPLIDGVSFTEFKSRVREEARRLNLAGVGQQLGIERSDPDVVQAHVAQQKPKAKKKNGGSKCKCCGKPGHVEAQCYKRIAEKYIADQIRLQQSNTQYNFGSQPNRNNGNYPRDEAMLAMLLQVAGTPTSPSAIPKITIATAWKVKTTHTVPYSLVSQSVSNLPHVALNGLNSPGDKSMGTNPTA